jgi:hypothetical protein
MSYCRFYNTLNDLRDCEDALMNSEELSKEEHKSAVSLVKKCRDITSLFEEMTEEEIKKEIPQEEE